MGYVLGREIRGRKIADYDIEFRFSYHPFSYHPFSYLFRDGGESEELENFLANALSSPAVTTPS